MARHIIRFTLKKNDRVLSEWFRLAREQEYNLSATIHLAVLYHALTNKYLFLGDIYTSPETQVDKKPKNISFPEQGAAYDWIREQKENGFGETELIRYVLLNGIKKGEKSNLRPEEELFAEIEAIRIEPRKQEMKEPVVNVENEKKKEGGKKQEKKSPERTILGNLLPGKGFSLGEE